jgi:hypothetical protein
VRATLAAHLPGRQAGVEVFDRIERSFSKIFFLSFLARREEAADGRQDRHRRLAVFIAAACSLAPGKVSTPSPPARRGCGGNGPHAGAQAGLMLTSLLC